MVSAILTRLAAVAFIPSLHPPQVFEHEEIALNIVNGVGFQWSHLGRDYLSMRPLFVYLCALVYRATAHGHLVMLVLQAIITGLAVLATAAIARRVAGPAVAVVAAAGVAFEPGLLYYDVVNIHPLGLQTLLFTLLLLSVVRVMTNPSPAAFAVAGAALAAAVYERGTALFFVPAALVFVWRETGIPLARLARLTLVLIATAAALHAPWLIRNWVVYGEPIFIMTAAPELLWIGNNPESTGTAFGKSGRPAYEDAPAPLRARVAAAPSEQAQMQAFTDEVHRYWRTEPASAATLYLRKLYYSWWFSPRSGATYHPGMFAAYRVVYAVEAGFALIGAATLWSTSRRRHVLALLAFLAIVSAVQSVFFVEGRHRLATMPAILVFSAAGVLAIVPRLRTAALADASPRTHGTARA